jgi:hypothetical protein
MSRPTTRRDAAQRTGSTAVSSRPGVREWLASLEQPGQATAAATFDTRIGTPDRGARVPGSAAKAAARRLSRRCFRLITSPQSFCVEDVSGPVAEGEITRARRWGETLASQLSAPDPAAGSTV